MTSRHPDSYPQAALVTGAARRIGRALALDLAAQGFAVAVHYHESEAEALSLVETIRGQGGKAALLRADLGQEAETQTLVERAQRLVGPLGLLVNNASVFDYDDPRVLGPPHRAQPARAAGADPGLRRAAA